MITYGRVSQLEESLESFLRQNYDGEKELLIVNDCPFQTLYFEHPEVKIINCKETFSTIGAKENFATENCIYDTIAQWDDDDLALSNHLQNINKYFPGYDYLHWQNGIAMVTYEIAAIRSLGNSGVVYSKDIWEKVGGYPLENAGYDMTYLFSIKKIGGKIVKAFPLNNEISWIYTWGDNGVYNMSGMGSDIGREDNVLKRHGRHIERLRKEGVIPEGDIVLNPNWSRDYEQMLKDYNNVH
jgi:hypothetical protein